MSSRIETSLNYLAFDTKYAAEKPYTSFINLSDLSPVKKNTNIVLQSVQKVSITDLRQVNIANFSLDNQGFELAFLGQQFRNSDFDDEEWIRNVYYPYICRFLVNKLDGAKEAHVFEHQVDELLLAYHLL